MKKLWTIAFLAACLLSGPIAARAQDVRPEFNPDVLIQDRNPADRFTFSLLHYASLIPKSDVEVHDTKSVRVTMPDFR